MPAERDANRDEPVSLAPLDPETALRALLATGPHVEQDEDHEDDQVRGESDA